MAAGWAVRQRRARREENRQLRMEGHSIPVARTAYRVDVTAIELPGWALASALKSVSTGEQHVWLRSRRMAKLLLAADLRKGGNGSIDATEYRCCLRCRGLLLGREATEMREWQRTHPGQEKPCGEECQ